MRRILFQRRPMAEWTSLLSHNTPSIRWVVPWWYLTEMVGCTDAWPFLRLIGPSGFTYLFPSRLLRQYGQRQVIPRYGAEPPTSVELKGSEITKWEQYWNSQVRWPMAKNLATTALSPSYQKWMVAKTKEERDEARRLELVERGIGINQGCHVMKRKRNPATPKTKVDLSRPDNTIPKPKVPKATLKSTVTIVEHPEEGTSHGKGDLPKEEEVAPMPKIECISLEEIVRDPSKEDLGMDIDPKHARRDN